MLPRDDGIVFCLPGMIHRDIAASLHRFVARRSSLVARRSSLVARRSCRGRVERLSFEGQWNSLSLKERVRLVIAIVIAPASAYSAHDVIAREAPAP
ncbi:hypothetical protein [Sorangium sp. So ce1153]|uniref:hypothetical protein n=1 Tax=Sorangium sp. So ce1153 TaxID=3133333 RepID=UPI003F61DF1D